MSISQPSPAQRLLIPCREAAAMLAISERLMWTIAKNNQIETVRVGKRGVRFRLADIEAFVAKGGGQC